jgi:type VI secretion system protein VasG
MLEAAVGQAASSQSPDVTVEHMLLQLLARDDGEAAGLLHEYGVDRRKLISHIETILHRTEGRSSSRPVFSETLFRWFEDAWLYASVERGEFRLRSGVLFFQFLRQPGRYSAERFPLLEKLSLEQLSQDLGDLLAVGSEAYEATPDLGQGGAGEGQAAGPRPPSADGSALSRFCRNFTEEVREGRIDPIFGRHREIRQMIDILCRRRKNNPVVVGEAGVGKTAMAEGLAHELVAGRVPSSLKNTDLLGLDLGLLQAGASVKGEFENRLKAVIDEVKSSAKPIILFIDEAHVMIGAGGQKGGSDAANLLKPALARGELRTIAATTWSEFKKYFEKDAALERRFQPVKIDEPSRPDAMVMLRGLKQLYEKAHGVRILDEAVVAAVELSDRYIAGRQLPDKAVDLLDTTAARVRVERESKPEELVELEEKLASYDREISALRREVVDGRTHLKDRLAEAEAERADVDAQRNVLTETWLSQVRNLEQLIAAREAKEAAKKGEEGDETPTVEIRQPQPPRVDGAVEESGEGADQTAEQTPADETTAPEAAAPEAVVPEEPPDAEEAGEKLVHIDVDADSVARTVASWTGIPLGRMQRDTVSTVLDLETRLGERVVGQEPAIQAVAETLRASFAGIRNPDTPVGVMLFVGPSGIGKTETGLALADLLYGGERFVTSINMTEFMEKHSLSRLIGSPPGYVGFGEGGVLTEAVRQRPYSIVLLDECEKAANEVMNLFYQVFDKGVLSDGEGRPINFRNTLIILTSNLASDIIMEMYGADETPSPEEVVDRIRPALSDHFRPALLGRMSIVPYRPIDQESMRTIAQLKLGQLAARIEESHGFLPHFDEVLVDELARRCTAAETGARNLDHIIRGSLSPLMASELLAVMSDGDVPTGLEATLAPDGSFRVDVDVAEG